MNWGAIATSVPDGAYWVCRSGRGLVRRGLFELELVVLGEDRLVRRTMIGHIGVMVPAEDVGRSLEGMVADPPTPLRVAVHLAHAGVDTDAHGADEGGLTEVGPEAGPEVVIQVRSAVQRPRVEREPVANGTDEGDQQRNEDDQEEYAAHPGGPVPRVVRRVGRRRGDRRVAGLRRSGR